MDKEFMDQIKWHSQKLVELMEDPHPGLSTWSSMVAEHAQWITDWWKGKFAKKD